MNERKIPNPKRIRKITGSFGFIPHRFLQDGFLSSLSKHETALYLFWILVADRFGISYYGDIRICKILNISEDELQEARTGLIEKNLISWSAPWIQVLELPMRPLVSDGPTAPPKHSFGGLARRSQSTPQRT